MKLESGKKYDWRNLSLIGWTRGDGSGHAGYCVADYFDENGIFLGPDDCGIQPIFIDCVVESLSLPLCSHGFRSGYAYATVDGVRKALYTSEPDCVSIEDHEERIRLRFEAGQGEAIE